MYRCLGPEAKEPSRSIPDPSSDVSSSMTSYDRLFMKALKKENPSFQMDEPTPARTCSGRWRNPWDPG